jgi:Flp pilus assembly protein TadG
MRSSVVRRGPRRGAAVVEFAVLLPVIVLLVAGVWEVGRMVEVNQMLTNAAREGARQAATGNWTNAQVATIVQNYLTKAGINAAHVSVVVTNLDSGADASVAAYQDRLEVDVALPFGDVSWGPLFSATTVNGIPMFPGLPSTLTATAVWVSMNDQPFPNFPTPPTG